MARIRTIKPEFWTHEALSEVPESTALLAIALLNYADDQGYFNANPSLIKAACFPIREPLVSIPDSLKLLYEIGYIRLGTIAGGRRVGHVVNFDAHQRVSHASPTRFDVKSIQWDTYDDSAHPPEIFRKPPESFVKPPEVLRPEWNREQGKEQGKEYLLSGSANADESELDLDSESDSEDEIEDKTKPPVEYTQDFLAFYDAYPKRQGKRSAAKAFALAKRRKPPPEIIQAAKDYAAAIVWQEPRFIPLPATWLNQDRFDDDRSEWLEPAARDAARLKAKLDMIYGKADE